MLQNFIVFLKEFKENLTITKYFVNNNNNTFLSSHITKFPNKSYVFQIWMSKDSAKIIDWLSNTYLSSYMIRSQIFVAVLYAMS